jgi:predicted amidohydrolase YtcJ
MRARNADWHETYTLPSQMAFYDPSRESHGSYWYDWTTWDEVAWKNFYRVWMEFLNDYKNRGGRVTVGSDSGFIYQLYGFGTILELELLQEAGFHPLEVIRAATYHGAQELAEPTGERIDRGVVKVGMLADLIVVDQNPVANLQVLYGTGAVKLNDETGKPERVGGVRYTIKGGIVYDAKQLLADVAAMVEKAKAASETVDTTP